MRAWSVQVPASSANLGPGFDALGLALGVYLTCRFRPAAALAISVSGLHQRGISTGSDNLIWQTAVNVAECQGEKISGVELHIVNDIPLGKGLGSSAAALTMGVILADSLLGLQWSRQRVLEEAARIEGHPDNVAACALGSFVASAFDDRGAACAIRLPVPRSFCIAVVVPDFALPTHEARAVLPTCYSRDDSVHNVQRAALLVAAVATGSAEVFPAALADRLHQPYRAKLVPGLEEATRIRIPGLLGCALSGAGPSVLVFYETGHEAVCERVRQSMETAGARAEILWTGVDEDGFRLEEWNAESTGFPAHSWAS